MDSHSSADLSTSKHSATAPRADFAPQVSPAVTPQRLSALYQYHNAPEVAPAHGLEYDDTVYPVSDKYPVIHQYSPPKYDAKDAYAINNRPPRIIFGMKVRTFLVVAVVFILIIVGAAVGGAVGGRNMHGGSDSQANVNPVSPSTATSSVTSGAKTVAAASSTTTTAAAVTPTYTPISDCPASNDTSYTSTYASGSSGTVPSGSGLNFTKYCDTASPFSGTAFSAKLISQAFVYTFDDCVEICAGYNFYASSSNCTVAVYEVGGSRPGNCQVGYAKVGSHSDLDAKKGTAVALLAS
ncbi:hypothetical protein MBLNU459_g4047t1 [Dothideomycetes sp. NU459]